MIDLIASKRSAIAELCARHHVSRLSLFGSAARDDFDISTSDIDLLVTFAPTAHVNYADNYFQFLEELEATLGRRVDLVSESAVKNPYLLRSINADQVQLYAA
jgi:predicted nucleotidyltransferase